MSLCRRPPQEMNDGANASAEAAASQLLVFAFDPAGRVCTSSVTDKESLDSNLKVWNFGCVRVDDVCIRRHQAFALPLGTFG